eukprot:CAMPEP_0176351060 /NCGR_PEP_ID=MMETSP0126-20121128/9945_1 /TAXON_ID=141414 ORGANISM="Strombidinopsis acuminatum, Strain SPMC142" /NCGR_SAMPLE_ID=MMETSP0126 /ASSEMBLY_ACC=CAM_ASM_000229 /LENGTH=142 /DNA_ID=CAMNT_0017701389 /DNA_START=512 /DNA_END=940 /DNA_ORIENTATION=+
MMPINTPDCQDLENQPEKKTIVPQIEVETRAATVNYYHVPIQELSNAFENQFCTDCVPAELLRATDVSTDTVNLLYDEIKGWKDKLNVIQKWLRRLLIFFMAGSVLLFIGVIVNTFTNKDKFPIMIEISVEASCPFYVNNAI